MYIITVLKNYLFQNALNAQRVAALVKTAETMGILDTSSETTKQSDIDEILGFLAALEKVSEIRAFWSLALVAWTVEHLLHKKCHLLAGIESRLGTKYDGYHENGPALMSPTDVCYICV